MLINASLWGRARIPVGRAGLLLLLSAPLVMAESSLSSAPPSIQITSAAFREGDTIPREHTCDGVNISPSLRWTGIPKGTQSIALLMEDPDAPKGNWVHWVLYNLPPAVDYLPQALPPIRKLANAEKHGTNDFGKLGYGGPCPPSGVHRYYIRLFALDRLLTSDAGLTRDELMGQMQGHVLARGELMGRYGREPQAR